MASGHRDRPHQSHATASVIEDSTTELTMPISVDVAAAASGSRGNKPARKRSRTSRRAPTTLLNTDTTNFRAMVQQFTGVPSVPYTASYMPAGATTLNFGIGFHNPVSQSPTILPSYGVQQNQYQYQYQYRQPPQQQEIIGFGIGENIEDDRHQVLESSREVGLGLPEEFFLDGIGGQVNHPRQPSENNRGGGYFL
ncbi:hypothetical protein KFK09_025125 [Dendrobium nobile]|uniref:VQ domain-containing protein n=1 Tax=Dendrobium nobile TaxID=94219 RepID=A0A8T3AFL7_DENNO|nr:hypothetical protein KFK09_025125 [Dendrobium nobile]